MRILQVSDIHIAKEGIDTFEVDVRKNFLRVLDAIDTIEFDRIVLSGDLCFREPDKEIYHWIKQQLDDRGIEPLVITGNHDDPVLVSEVFDIENDQGEIYYSRTWNSHKVIFLDTGAGTISDRQVAWLKGQLNGSGECIIFMHYPPVPCGVPYMDDNHAFRDGGKTLPVLTGHGDQITIFTGHYHVERIVNYKNLSVAITPSTFFQIDASQEEFQIDHYRVGFRIIDIVDGAVRHWVHYLD